MTDSVSNIAELSNIVELARARAASFGPFDPARYVAMDEACGARHVVVVRPNGRRTWAADVCDADYRDDVQELALDFWIKSDRVNVRRLIDYLIGQGRVQADAPTGPAAELMSGTQPF
jgi:hypothetical protein